MRSGAPQWGTSLIEVLVVLVILVIGILAIARLFPAGFVALRHAENNNFADRLAQGLLEGLKQDGAAQTDGIYMYTETLGFDPNVLPDDVYSFQPDGSGYNTSRDVGPLVDPADPNSYFNNVNKQRYISNETVTVGGNRDIGAGASVPLHFLAYGPIYLPPPPTDVSQPVPYLTVNGVPWTPRRGDSRINPADNPLDPAARAIDNPQDILEAGRETFLVDYDGGKLAFPTARYNQTFNVVVQTDTGPVAFSLTTHGTDYPNPYDGRWFDQGIAGTSQMVDVAGQIPVGPWSAVSLYRPFQRLAAVDKFTDDPAGLDPYTYVIYSPNVGTTNMGVLAFNPLAAGQGGGASPLKARLSYMTLDWHILHEDHDVAAGVSTVRLRLAHLKKVGDIQFDQTQYNGLLPGAPAANQSDILMLNLDTGVVTGLNDQDTNTTLDLDTTDTPDTSKYQVSYQNGRVTFPASSKGGRVRFFYAGDADWAVAVQKAASYYTRSLNPDSTDNTDLLKTPSTQRQPADPQTPNQYAVGSVSRIYFPRCDAGKTVEFDGITYYRKDGTSHQIGVGTATISTDVDTNGLPYVNLTGAGLNSSNVLVDPNYDPNPPSPARALTFNAVRGVSARAIVIWRERNLWRRRVIDTLLTRTQ